jgi:hypothetical protein
MAERYPTSLKLDASLKLRVQRLALTHGRTAHGLLCDAIRAFVEQEEQRLAAGGAAFPSAALHAQPRAHHHDDPRVHDSSSDASNDATSEASGSTAGQPGDAGDAGSA